MSGGSGSETRGESIVSSGQMETSASSPSQRPGPILEAEIAEARLELQRLGRQINIAERQLKVLGKDRRMHGLPRPSDKEKRLANRLNSLRLRRKNVRRWITRCAEDLKSRENSQDANDKEADSRGRKKKGGKSNVKNSRTKKKRSKVSAGRKKAARVARDSPSRGISSTGRRSRARLIG